MEQIPGKLDFESEDFLTAHVEEILAFYEPVAFDKNGGFFQHFLDDGTVYDRETRHLVSSTRFVFNYANAFLQTGRAHYREWAAHGLRYLETHHRTEAGHFLCHSGGGMGASRRDRRFGRPSCRDLGLYGIAFLRAGAYGLCR